ncbi:hypothetical protein SEA_PAULODIABOLI_142 [Microbacterium phage PauloDiaboli]|nr:hypothetical protein SEA_PAULODIABOLI_142 [Microbacterium phage PauloDiaboli]QWY83975.1 hypothetical protein SEA_A3WALLY_138 [Microbacterium phage A3Wally]
MTIEEHPELPDNYRSTSGNWVFTLEENGDLDEVDEAIEAWREWREFLVQREVRKTQEPLF